MSDPKRRRRSIQTTIDDLPGEIIQDILSRLPIRPVFHSRCVSPYWRSLIDDNRFPTMHYTQSSRYQNYVSLVLCRTSHYQLFLYDLDACEKITKLRILPFRLWGRRLKCFKRRIVGSCNGLICLSNNYAFSKIRPKPEDDTVLRHDMVIYNPMIKSWKKIPTPFPPPAFKSVEPFGFGYNAINNEYKVFCKVWYKDDDGQKIKISCIITIGSRSWRAIETNPRPDEEKVHGPGIYCSGYLHWLVSDSLDKPCFIRTLDIDKENFAEISLPDSVKAVGVKSRCAHLGVLGGSIVVATWSELSRVTTWRMKESGVNSSWVNEFVIQLPETSANLKVLGMKRNGNVVLQVGCTGFYSYDPNTGNCEELRRPGPWCESLKAFPHMGTLLKI